MTKKMPDRIKSNFIYRRIWRLIKKEEMNAVLLFIGDVGKGKSTGAQKFAVDLDKKFNLERICFNAEQFLKLLDKGDSLGKLKRGSVIIFDEAVGSEESPDSRQALSHTNKILSWFTTISRAKGYIIIYCAPFMSQLDKRIRMIGITGIADFKGVDRNKKLGIAHFYWCYGSSKKDKVLTPEPRIKDTTSKKLTRYRRIKITSPPAELMKAYKVRKMDFINSKITDWRREIVSRKGGSFSFAKKCEEALERKEEIKGRDGKYSLGLIRMVLGVGENTSHHIKGWLDNMEIAHTS